MDINLALIEQQKRDLSDFFRIASITSDKYTADDCRLAVYHIDDFLVVDLEKLDIFSHTTKIIPDWQPTINIQSYQNLSKLYIDIETDGGVEVTDLKVPTKDLLVWDTAELKKRGYFDPRPYSLKMIGLRNEKRNNIFLRDDSEEVMIREFLRILSIKSPNLLINHNIIKFDLPFIIAKCVQYGISHPFYINYDRVSTYRTAQMFGKPTQFHAIYCKINGKKIHIIDTLHQLLAFDFVARKLTAYNLKEAPLQLELRKDARLDLGFEGLLDCYSRGDWATVQEYLQYDLEDTELLANFLMPSIYYQLLFVTEFPLQNLSTMGNGTKWNSLLKREYNGFEPEASVKKRFTGGKTSAYAGLFKYVSKVDVASLYPTIMLAYGICSEKDPQLKSLGVLKYCKTVRIGFKTLKNFNNNDFAGSAIDYLKLNSKAVQLCLHFATAVGYDYNVIQNLKVTFEKLLSSPGELQNFEKLVKGLSKDFFKNEGSLKVFINSAYGFLATTGIPYNDMVAGALVTAYGRKILKFMEETVLELGGTIVNVDTDACTYSAGSPEKNAYIFEELKKRLPKWVEIEHEFQAEAVFVPPIQSQRMIDFNKNYKVSSKHCWKFFYKTFSSEDENLGLSAENPNEIEKAYLWLVEKHGDEKVTFDLFMKAAEEFEFTFPRSEDGLRKNYLVFFENKVKSYGRFKKRDRNLLDKEFQLEYLKLYMNDPKTADEFYQSELNNILSGNYPPERLAVKRKIRKGEVKLVQLGLGVEGDVITFYKGATQEYVKEGAYNIEHYATMLKQLYSDLQTAFMYSQNRLNKVSL